MQITDKIYGIIDVPDFIEKIVLTPQMQRLRNIHQLGFVCRVIQNVEITRFEHCLGTYHATCKMLESLEKNSNNGNIPQLLLVAVKIAALLHDVGHGPFSHTWERIAPGFKHENNAIPCIDSIFQYLSKDCLPELRENNNYGVKLIKAIITGNRSFLDDQPLEDHFGFIFEIVNNQKCKLDTDKWDYLKRDYYYLKHAIDLNIDFDDVFMKARVSADGKHIEYRYEDYSKIYEIFEARWKLHVHCYRIPAAIACDYILKDILSRLNPNISKINGKNLTEINAFDMSAFLKLTEKCVFEIVKNDTHYKYLENPNKLERVDNNISLGESKILLYVEEKIKGPGVVMPADEKFFLYGDPRNKSSITRNTEETVLKYSFILRRL